VNKHSAVSSLLAAWTVNACDAAESDAVNAHLSDCETCRAEARDLIDAAEHLGGSGVEPPDSLRDKVLSVSGASAAYAATVAALDALLRELDPDQWSRLAAYNEWTVLDLVVHLTATDNLVAAQLGLPVDPPVAPGEDPDTRTDLLLAMPKDRSLAWAAWRGQAAAISHQKPTTDLMVSRAFETWIHAHDIATATHKTLPPPPPNHLHTIADFTARLLPPAAGYRHLAREGNVVRLVLTGPGGGTWTLPLTETDLGVTVEMTMNVLEFCLLMAARREPRAVDVMIRGDVELGYDLLDAGPTLAPK
jgi:uncharacterized protein (TIGR03083 family)